MRFAFAFDAAALFSLNSNVGSDSGGAAANVVLLEDGSPVQLEDGSNLEME